jgi:uncharacterized protein YndB with AHSA1/START domain
MTADPSSRTIVTTRIIHAPREKVWQAWTTGEKLARWWGPKGFTNTFHEFNPVAGGLWRFTMHGPNDLQFENKSVFVELQKPERIVFDHQKPMHPFRAIVTFEAIGDSTKIIWQMVHDTVEECEKVKSFVIPGNEENLDKLEAELATK